ncbi:MAG: EF-P lysine aminoacylase EpmA [Planctomycetota bacterium]
MLEMIQRRAALLKELRSFFDARGFSEVQPPCLGQDCVVDAYLNPIEVDASQLGLARSCRDDAGAGEKFVLQTSPESAMKRMLAAGAPSIYSIGPVFRRGESGDHHNVEFTMLEWYDVDAGIEDGIRLLGELACQTLKKARCEVISYRELFRRHAGFDPIDLNTDSLARKVDQIDSGLGGSIGKDRDSMLDVILGEVVQPQLQGDQVWIVRDYPLTQAALAKPSVDDPDCAARFELFVDGVELANGYDELLDADELVKRFRANNEKRREVGMSPLRVETKLVDAMRRGLPACCGVALGVDRLLMCQSDATAIGEVLPFLIDEA